MTTTAAHRRARTRATEPASSPAVVRVACYTRKSSEKGLDQAFNSIDAQRQMLEDFVAQHAADGWVALVDRYDDGGFSGGNTKRPGLQRLLAAVRAGHIDKVAVYRLDRLSRSTVDFVHLMDLLRCYGVEVVSPNERIENATASDRLTLGVRMQVSQFEREIAAERIRDKMKAARLRGLWMGGRAVLGYDVDRHRLVANETEAEDVRAIFALFLRTRSLVATLRELNVRGIKNKSWLTQRGRHVDGQAFSKNTLTRLLTSVVYVGQFDVEGKIVKADHTGIVPRELFDQVQAIFAESKAEPGRPERQVWSALLTGLLRCAACGSAMVPTYSVKGSRRYGYYQCQRTKAQGATACPGSRVAQGPIESAVVERIAAIGRDPALADEAVRAAHAEVASRRAELAQDARRCGLEVQRQKAESDALVAAIARQAGDVPELRQKLAVVREELQDAQARAKAVRDELASLKASVVSEDELRRAIVSFTPVWTALFPAERARLVRLLVERVSFDARTGDTEIQFHANGIATLASQGDAA